MAPAKSSLLRSASAIISSSFASFLAVQDLGDLAVGMAAFVRLEPSPGAQDLPAARSHAAALGLALELDQTRGTERAQARPQVRQHRGREIEIPDEGEQPP